MSDQPRPLTARTAPGPLKGTARVPGDKSISHRALMLGGVARGTTRVTGLLEGEDVINTARAMRLLGADITRAEGGVWTIEGTASTAALKEPEDVLQMGNSGTSARLLIGLVSGQPVTCVFTGDSSLVKRPMGRITTPLRQMGAQFLAREGGRLPLAVRGAEEAMAIEYRLPVASAQVKSAILLAGLSAAGETAVIESVPTRDHSENMLRHFGVDMRRETLEDGCIRLSLSGYPELAAADIAVPADPSSAAFPLVAALLVPGSDLTLPGVCVNPRRAGLISVLKEMGADISIENQRIEGGEPLADLRARYTGPLRGIRVDPALIPDMIDECPILAVAAAFAEGATHMAGLGELRVKESDRLAVMAKGLADCGVDLEEGEDSLTIHGTGKPPAGGAAISASHDHRIAMSFAVLGLAAQAPVRIDDFRPVDTSFPGFADLMNDLGADLDLGAVSG